MDICT